MGKTLISRRMWRPLCISKRGNCVSRDIQVSVGMIHLEYKFFFKNCKKSGWMNRQETRVAGKLKVGTFKINRVGIRKPGDT